MLIDFGKSIIQRRPVPGVLAFINVFPTDHAHLAGEKGIVPAMLSAVGVKIIYPGGTTERKRFRRGVLGYIKELRPTGVNIVGHRQGDRGSLGHTRRRRRQRE